MPRPGRKTVEVPLSLYTALDQLAEERGMLTSELAAKWVWERLKTECPALTDPSNPERVPDPIRYSTYPRRTKCQPAGHEASHLSQAYAAKLEEHQRFIENERGEA